MKYQDKPSVYDQIAYDVATKVAMGEIAEGFRFSGRSLMGSQYNVSPETIRRAMKILADYGIITVKSNSGLFVASRQRAVDFVEQHQSGRDLVALKSQLEQFVTERDELNGKINSVMAEIIDMEERFQSSDRFKPIEFTVVKGCPAEGKSIGDLKFRQNTGATIIAIRHEGEEVLSPGPECILKAKDTLVVVCKVEDIGKILPLLGKT
ncbi:MAG: GntR family transcriptional regulator [Bacteroidales bacterium]|jgi:K+/H+ antiporter YhaU regulatory subunit KhtT|nr:GntR family transcriptional regulator [Bacteroidales bacterium]